MIATRQNDLQIHKAQVAELNALQAVLQNDLDTCRLKMADMTADANVKDLQIASLEVGHSTDMGCQ